MNKIFKWIGIVLGSLIGLLLALVVVFLILGNMRLNKSYDFPADNVVIPTDEASLERGRHITETSCASCHGADLGGVDGWFKMEGVGEIDSANLTTGLGGVGSVYTSDADYVRAIRHGIGADGKPIFMPAVLVYQRMSDEDLGAVIAYLKVAPSVNHETKGLFDVMGKIMLGAGMFGNLPVEEVSHTSNVTAPAASVTVEYGEYLATLGDCSSCHGADYAGGAYPDPAITLPVPNITPAGNIGAWTEEEFIATMRTGVTPEGKPLVPTLMPFRAIGKMSYEELKAVYLFLTSLPAVEK
jgi:mono/diheme cytochrome c family protein